MVVVWRGWVREPYQARHLARLLAVVEVPQQLLEVAAQDSPAQNTRAVCVEVRVLRHNGERVVRVVVETADDVGNSFL